MNSSDKLEPENPTTGTRDGQTEAAKPRRWLATALRVGLSIAAILLLMLWILGSFRKDQIRPGKAAVPEKRADGLPTYTVAFTQIPGVNEAVGTVRAEHIATVTSRIVGAILQVRVTAGQRIAKGEVLAELDDRDLRSRLEQAREAVRAAEATLSKARSDYKRDKPLFEQRVISAYDFEHTETNLKTAEANLDRLKQAQQEAEVNLSYAVIRSPFDGVVVDRLAEAGELAAPGRPLLTMYQEGRLWLEASVPEEQLAAVRVGQAYTVRIDAL
ncbi:MAG: efflux RND transporter periplasmic adaptor subunit, partial [Bryobacteraceae bacterium]